LTPDFIDIVANGGNDVENQDQQKMPEHKKAEAEHALSVVQRADKGDKAALAELGTVFKSFPALVDFFGKSRVENTLVHRLGDLPTNREAIRAKMESTRADLAGPNPTPIERLLVDRVVACWLQLAVADKMAADGDGCSMTVVEAEYRQRRQNHANKRYLAALRTLAVVQRLAKPIRLNVKVTSRDDQHQPGPQPPNDNGGLVVREVGDTAHLGHATLADPKPSRRGNRRATVKSQDI
jgi:hypothetical protein